MSGLGATEMGCPREEHERDAWLMRFFSAEPKIVLQGSRLTLNGGAARLVFLDRTVADPDRPLRATSWQVAEYIEAGSSMALLKIQAPTLVFAADGSWTVHSTCSDGAGKYTLDGARIAITSADFTSRPCDEEHDQTAARVVRAVLTDGELRYRIKAGSLRLESDKRGLGLRAAATLAR